MGAIAGAGRSGRPAGHGPADAGGAVDEESAREASERIEPNVRPVRMLHGAAEAVSADIVSALGSDRVTPAGLPAALDLLVEISYGQSSVVARIEGDEGLARRCRGIIRRFLPVIHALDRADGGQRCPPGGRRPGWPSEDLGVGATGSSEGFRAGAGGQPAGPVPGAAGGGRRGGEGTTAVRGLRPALHGVGRGRGPTAIRRRTSWAKLQGPPERCDQKRHGSPRRLDRAVATRRRMHPRVRTQW